MRSDSSDDVSGLMDSSLSKSSDVGVDILDDVVKKMFSGVYHAFGIEAVRKTRQVTKRMLRHRAILVGTGRTGTGECLLAALICRYCRRIYW